MITHKPYDGETMRLWQVTFAGDYAVITTRIEARDEDDAITLANDLLVDYYDLELARFRAEAEEVAS